MRVKGRCGDDAAAVAREIQAVQAALDSDAPAAGGVAGGAALLGVLGDWWSLWGWVEFVGMGGVWRDGALGDGDGLRVVWICCAEAFLTSGRVSTQQPLNPSQPRLAHIHTHIHIHTCTHFSHIHTHFLHTCSSGYAALLRPPNVRPLLIGMSLMLFQQITGQPSVLYYAATIFQRAGFATATEATKTAVLLGIFKLLMTGVWCACVAVQRYPISDDHRISDDHVPHHHPAPTRTALAPPTPMHTVVAVATVDRLGRRPLLLAGVAGMVAALVALAISTGSLEAAALAATADPTLAAVSVVALLLYVGWCVGKTCRMLLHGTSMLETATR